jgi:hypothetical protein
MHIRGSTAHNTAIRIETILYELDSDEYSNQWELQREAENWKFNGRSATVEDYNDEHVVLTREGAVRYGYSKREIEELFPQYKTKREEFEDEELKYKTFRELHNPKKLKWADYEDEDNYPKAYVELPPEVPVHCNSTPKVQVEIDNYISDHMAELEKLGFEPGKYVYPDINPGLEEKSVRNHLELYKERCDLLTHPPTSLESKRCAGLVLQLIPNNKYEPDVDYKTAERIISIIDSSLVNEKKSPGHPYQADGMPVNSAVIARYTKGGLAQIVFDKWHEKFHLKSFLKAEPTKVKKLEKGMPRVITGLPLHKMLKHQTIFKNMLDVAVEKLGDSPIKYGFSPVVSGNIDRIAECFVGRKVYESDKSNWDFMFHGYIYDICENIVEALAVQPADMSDEAFEDYKIDVRNSFLEMKEGSKYRCTNGKVFQSTSSGIMKSGWLLTIFVNSLAQIVCDVLIKMRMGVSDEDILSKDHYMIAGGDDVLQTFPENFDTKRYISEAKKLGLVLEPFIEHESFDGCEYFGTKYRFDEGVWKFKPVRFTKHIEALRRVKIEDLPCALASHMLNYTWDKSRFSFLEKTFRNFRKTHPQIFTLNFLKSRRELEYKVLGLEARFPPSN